MGAADSAPPPARTFRGCLTLAAKVQTASSSVGQQHENASKCARMSRRVQNLVPMMAKLVIKLEGTSSSFCSGATSRGKPAPVTLEGSADCSPSSAIGGGGPRSPVLAASSARLASLRSDACASQPVTPAAALAPFSYAEESPPLGSVVGPRAKAMLLRIMSSSAHRRASGLFSQPTQLGAVTGSSEHGEGDPTPGVASSSSPSPGKSSATAEAPQRPSPFCFADEVVARALAPTNSFRLPETVLETLAPTGGSGAGSHLRVLADQVVVDCHSAIADALRWIQEFGSRSVAAVPEGGPQFKLYQAINDRLSAAFSDLMYVALAFNINVEHQTPPAASSCGGAQQQQQAAVQALVVRDLLSALVKREVHDELARGAGNVDAGAGSSRWLQALSEAERSRVRAALSPQGIDLEQLVNQSALSVVAMPDVQVDAARTPPAAMLAAQLLAVMPQPTLPSSSLAFAQRYQQATYRSEDIFRCESSAQSGVVDVIAGLESLPPAVVVEQGEVVCKPVAR